MIVDIRADQGRPGVPRVDRDLDAAGDPFGALPDFDFGDEREPGEQAPRHLVAPVVALTLSAAWIGCVAWVAWRSTMLIPADYLVLVTAMAAVPTLIGIAWLLLLRTSRAESRRFGHTAEAMRAEAAALERSVAAMTRTLDANRLELAGQIEQLAAMGSAAGERLTAIGHGITAEIAAADSHAQQLAAAAATAQASVGVLLASLPRATGDTEELTQALAASGEVALRHVEALGTQLIALAERGRNAETGAGQAAAALADHVAAIERSSDGAVLRLELSLIHI